MYYLAYGSNLNLEEMKDRCPSAKKVGSIILEDYRLVYKGSNDGYSYLTIEPSVGDFVPLGLFEISFLDVFKLDRYEGYPTLYSKVKLPINFDGKETKALIYIMKKGYDYHIPSKSYINTCMEGYNDFSFDTEILEQALIDTKENMKKKKHK